MEIKELSMLLLPQISAVPQIDNITILMNGRTMQLCMQDGSTFNVGIVKTQKKYNRQPDYVRGEHENDSSF